MDLETYEQQVNDLSEQNLDMVDDMNHLDGLSNEVPSKNISTFKVNLDQKQIEKSQNQEMLQKVRKTAKWSQLYKSGSTFPPKHKVIFMNQDEDQKEKRQPDEETLNEYQNKLQKQESFQLKSHHQYEDSLMKSGGFKGSSPNTYHYSKMTESQQKGSQKMLMRLSNPYSTNPDTKPTLIKSSLEQ